MGLPSKAISMLVCVYLTAIFPPVGTNFKQQETQPFTTACKTDTEIVTKEREIVNQIALEFVRDAIGANPTTAYALFTADAKESVRSDQFVSAFQNRIKPMAPFNNLRVAHTYMATVTGGSQEQRVICGNLSSPQSWVAVNAKPGPSEAYVLVEGQTVNNAVVFVVWLIPEQGNWRVQYVDYATTEMVGKSAVDLRQMGATEVQRHHNFNAYILYATALQLTDRGPFFQIGIRPDIEKEIAALDRPSDLEGRPPFVWQFEKSTFKILNVGAIGVGGKVYLIIDHEIESWAEDKEAEQQNRNLIIAFKKAYPEYRDAFAGLVVRAHERSGGRGYGTVDETRNN